MILSFSFTATQKFATTAFVPKAAYHRGARSLARHTQTQCRIGRCLTTISAPRRYSPVQLHLASVNTSYSTITQERLEGMDATDEFAKLAMKLNTPHDRLSLTLAQKLAAVDQTTTTGIQKAEYLDWLLSGAVDGSNGKPQTIKSAKEAATAGTSKKIRTLQTDKNSFKPSAPIIRKQAGHKTDGQQQQQQQQTFATDVTFADRDDLHSNSKRALVAMGLTSMTEIQDRTFAAASSGRDVLGRARTGTGKTIAFLLPAIERLLQLGVQNNNNNNNHHVGILVVSPTRELATQIGDQAEKLVSFHKGMTVQVMFGGTNMNRDVTRLSQKAPTILVATPGRLLDHMQSTKIGKHSFGKDIMSQTPIVILDETDRLLDMGFRREISKILGYLPQSTKRQTLLFSATIPPELKVIMAQNMNKDYIEVDCINDGDAATQTNEQVQQSHVVIPSNSARTVSSVVEVVRLAVLKYDSAESPAKVVVFFPTARLVNFYAELFNEGKVLPVPVLELHSKKSQSYRNRVSDEFRKIKKGVLFTSDVSARGVDYPNVSHVIQFGLPESREQYIHRLGRTGRGGTEGKGWLVLSEWESSFLQELKGVNIPVDNELREIITNPIDSESQELMENIRSRISKGDKVLSKSAKGAYQAFLGYYLGQMKRMRMNRKEQLVDIANDFAAMSGLQEPPSLTKMLVGKMGLKGISGIKISSGQDEDDGSQGKKKTSQGRWEPSHGHNDGRRAPKQKSGGRR